MEAKNVADWIGFAYAMVLLVIGTYIPIKLADWLYDGESYVVWWIVFLFLWPLVGTAVYCVGMIPVAVVALVFQKRA